MGGPIVRTGTTPKFWENYDRIFSGTTSKKAGAAKKETAVKAEAKAPKKAAAKKAAAKKKK
ncbi:MAG: RNA polymerase subunit sigma [Schlesneria sp.]